MRAVVFDAYGATPTLRDVPPPVCPPDGVVVAVGATGVCRSDWHAWRGHDPVAMPHVPGHELAGTVVEIGPLVGRLAVGDRVTVPFVCGCGRCGVCLAGDPQVCPDQRQPGFTDAGSFAELVALHAADHNVVRLPDTVDVVTAAALGCRFATAFRGLTVHGHPAPGSWVAVHGCGGVGLSAVMIAVALGCRVLAVDISAAALARAADLGAEIILDSTDLGGADAVGAQIQRLTGGAEVSIDALGSQATAVASVLGLRRRGRHVQIGLLLGDRARPALPMDRVISWELSLHGSHGMAAADYPAMLALIEDGRLDPKRLVGRQITLDEAGAALAAMDAPQADGMTVVVV
ncbi:alcohol dehydrogenase catalytic domain-containing protein [Nakamurella deserti]|uniref:alcohol dehydrogenase catalytic domain-containing protein n=1 Tax=Nakamurella deserti TaxID=2164074 RepID=UPI000DBE22B6|nr:alcohol dehydrogenase catalytic domain-containing protein [Nakamurella deserti]